LYCGHTVDVTLTSVQ